MDEIVNLSRYPLDDLNGPAAKSLITECQRDLNRGGMFNLKNFLSPHAVERILDNVMPVMRAASFEHKREHNIYFEEAVDVVAADHPALKKMETVNHTVCADQIPENDIVSLYDWEPFRDFLARVMQKEKLYTMPDRLACMNVMAYHESEALNWHFDRSEFTTTLLLQAPEQGGHFEYRADLRSAEDPNYDGVAETLDGRDSQIQQLKLDAGTLNVFRGKNTLHRVTPVVGDRQRVIAVFSYYERPDVRFSKEEQMGFYGRVG